MIAAANADPIPVFIELSLKGKWSPDLRTMLRDYVGVKIVERPNT